MPDKKHVERESRLCPMDAAVGVWRHWRPPARDLAYRSLAECHGIRGHLRPTL